MPGQDTVLTSTCVVVRRCEALYVHSTNWTFHKENFFKTGEKKEYEDFPVVLSECLYCQCLFFSLLECLIMVVIFVF